MRINLFGNLRMSFAGRPVTAVNTNRLHSLIAYLILHGDTPQPRERLAFTLWPSSSESQARTNLRQLLHHLKRALPAESNVLAINHFAVRWRRDVAGAIDVVDFQAAIAEAVSAKAENDRAREIQALTTAADSMKMTYCQRSTMTGSRLCVKTTGGRSPRCCTVSPHSSKRRRNTLRPSRWPSALLHWIRCPNRIINC